MANLIKDVGTILSGNAPITLNNSSSISTAIDTVIINGCSNLYNGNNSIYNYKPINYPLVDIENMELTINDNGELKTYKIESVISKKEEKETFLKVEAYINFSYKEYKETKKTKFISEKIQIEKKNHYEKHSIFSNIIGNFDGTGYVYIPYNIARTIDCVQSPILPWTNVAGPTTGLLNNYTTSYRSIGISNNHIASYGNIGLSNNVSTAISVGTYNVRSC